MKVHSDIFISELGNLKVVLCFLIVVFRIKSNVQIECKNYKKKRIRKGEKFPNCSSIRQNFLFF